MYKYFLFFLSTKPTPDENKRWQKSISITFKLWTLTFKIRKIYMLFVIHYSITDIFLRYWFYRVSTLLFNVIITCKVLYSRITLIKILIWWGSCMQWWKTSTLMTHSLNIVTNEDLKVVHYIKPIIQSYM